MNSLDAENQKDKYMHSFAVVVFADLKLKHVSMNRDAIDKIQDVLNYYEEKEEYEVCARLLTYLNKLKLKYNV